MAKIDWAKIRQQKARGSFYLDNRGQELSLKDRQEKIKAIFSLLFGPFLSQRTKSQKIAYVANLAPIERLGRNKQEIRDSMAQSLRKIRRSVYE